MNTLQRSHIAMENIRPRNDDEQDGNQYDYLYYHSAV